MLAPEGGTPLVSGSCFCGTITFSVFGPPVLSAYCHYQPAREALDHYENPLKPYKRRFRCKQCGSQVASFNTRTSQFSFWGACLERGPDGEILNWEQVKPTAHIFYGTRMLDVNDGLGKWEGYEGNQPRLEYVAIAIGGERRRPAEMD
ncbi:hypothetical protein JVU11DRAFT_5808 [Chiua virens]|nr:hypothetical protein JVU11DRAFT_5808 [Chiua virens]